MPSRGSSCSGGAASLYTRLLIAHEHSGKEHPLQAQYSHPKLRCFNGAFLIPKCVVPAGVPEPRSPSTPLCAVQAFSLIPQNKQDFFYIYFFFTPLLLFIFFLPFSTPPEPLLLVAGSPDSVGTQKCCESKPWLPSPFRNPLEGGREKE